MTHLWEVEHDYYGGANGAERFDSLDELDDELTRKSADVDGANFAYRWDWLLPGPFNGDPDGPELFRITFVSPRVSALWALEVAVTREQEPQVLALIHKHLVPWLRQMWAPILDEDAT